MGVYQAIIKLEGANNDSVLKNTALCAIGIMKQFEGFMDSTEHKHFAKDYEQWREDKFEQHVYSVESFIELECIEFNASLESIPYFLKDDVMVVGPFDEERMRYVCSGAKLIE